MLPQPASTFDWEGDRPLNLPLEDLVIYEAHVRGFTADPSSGVSAPGTYRGLVERLDYLQGLGVTAIELMPIHEFNELEYHQVNMGPRSFPVWGVGGRAGRCRACPGCRWCAGASGVSGEQRGGAPVGRMGVGTAGGFLGEVQPGVWWGVGLCMEVGRAVGMWLASWSLETP